MAKFNKLQSDPLKFTEKTIIKVRCESVTAGSFDISVDYTLTLVAN